MPSDVREPEWTAETINRKQGETTFQICGWCKFAGGGSCRYDAHLETSCSLDPSWTKPTLYFDTRCIWQGQGAADLLAAAERKSNEANGLRLQSKRADEAAWELVKLAEKAEPIPVQANNRKCAHFEVGNVVRVFHDGRWRRGTVVYGYRHQDGCVFWVYEGETMPPNGPIGCGMSVPSVMLEAEWEYLRDHPAVIAGWFARADRDYNGKRLPMAEMIAAFQEAPNAK